MEFVTAGESHGPALTAIVSDVPAGIGIDIEAIDRDLARRQSGYGRGGRQCIEKDHVEILSGVRFSSTLGTPVTLQVKNDDHANWLDRMAVIGDAPQDLVRETCPRPGHADLAGMMKIDTDDARDILERSSARETAARVAAGSIAKAFLAELGVTVRSYVRRIGSVVIPDDVSIDMTKIESSECRCPDAQTTQLMKEEIDRARENGESLGGEFVVVAEGLVPGLGGYASGPARLTSKLGAALFSIPAIKGVEFGLGFEAARTLGSAVHDPIFYDGAMGFTRATNNAGGLEGGMTNGEPLIIAAAMKPIPTLMTPLDTVDTDTLAPVKASKERSDVCAVPAAAVVAEAEVAFVLADAYQKKFGADVIEDIIASVDAYRERIAR